MRISLDALLVLDAIDRRGSFAAAAEELYRVPSAITYAVQKLEQDLDLQIYDRSGHRAKLTPAGMELLREGRQLLDAANMLECRVKRIATGWETELRIAVVDLIEPTRLFPVIRAFDQSGGSTRIRISSEVFGGAWDALVSGRADITVGAVDEGPAGGSYATREMGTVQFEFTAAPHHPICKEPTPLSPEAIRRHRAISAADSSRNMSPRTSGLLTGQDVLTMPNIDFKAEAQAAGLGVGFLPAGRARRMAAEGRVRILEVQENKPTSKIHLAWRAHQPGKALHWFLRHLQDEKMISELMQDV
ncbi:DNA-binding transcriptional LysR family regulator [Chitinivorax tropicus]|uniref:DNA-binding transcriptional LysR family regulator n=1 Tax=Chitinivorax tropicus TaxID=714531 RepID=A0A840MTG8_9PROT|nr:LysR family transcriptional regulator [Chitinivorax tropicus]MBB5019676.1 DNA-binding transcriptional LysR family regulator [Chitinivorax tropicus]